MFIVTQMCYKKPECDSLKTLLVRKSQQLVLWRTLRMLIGEIIPDQLWRAWGWISLGQFHSPDLSHPEMNGSENLANDLWFPLYLEREYKRIKRWAQEAMCISVSMTDERQLREQTPSYWGISTLQGFWRGPDTHCLLDSGFAMIHNTASKQQSRQITRLGSAWLCVTFSGEPVPFIHSYRKFQVTSHKWLGQHQTLAPN